MKYITIFADASFDHVTGAAGISMWARDAVNFHRASKALTFPVESASQAESVALGTAITVALRVFTHDPGDRLSIQSDCLHALDLFAPVPQRKKPWPGIEAAMRSNVLEASQQFGLSLHPKHVKGHSGKGNPRSAVNDWCDSEARSQMRKARKHFKSIGAISH
jgi:ribonuclease HI